MKELAKQRTKQLQEEEEERTRKQMAKARAKLEELNKRTNAGEGSTHKLENSSSSSMQSKQEESQNFGESLNVGKRFVASKSALGSKVNTVTEIYESDPSRVGKPPISSSELPTQVPKSGHREPVMLHGQSLPLQHEVTGASVIHHNNPPQVHESIASKQKRMGFKQKQISQTEKTSTDKFVSEAPKTQTDAVDIASLGVVTNEVVLGSDSSLFVNSNANVVDSSGHPRKKHNRNGKNRQRMEDASPLAAPPSLESKEQIANASVDTGKPKVSEVELDSSSVQSSIPKDADLSSDQHTSLPNEEAHSRVSNQWKPQQSRRVPRNPQANRSAEKFHGSDAVIWAPVRSQSKMEGTDEPSPKSAVEAVSLTVKSEHQVPNNSKNKRAEIERYVPKPVAKEMAQQGTNHQPVVTTTLNQTTTEEIIVRADTGSQGVESSQPTGMGVGKVGLPMDPRNGSGRQNKLGKAHGAWRQRVSTEPTGVQGLQDGPANVSNLGQHAQKSNEYHHPQKHDVSTVKEQGKDFDELNPADGWGIPNASNSDEPVSVSLPVVRDQGATARGKRHPFKGHKGTGNNNDHVQKKSNVGDADKLHAQSSASETSQTDLAVASKENRGTGERSTSHWQPKSQAFSANNQRGIRHNGSQAAGAEFTRASKKEFNLQELPPPLMHKDPSESVGQRHRDQSISERGSADETPSLRHPESKQERKLAPKGRPHSPNQGPINSLEPPTVGLDSRHEQPMSSGFRRSGNQNNRFGKGQESRGDWNYSGQDNNTQQNPPANRERQRHNNSHFEYQPIGSYNNKSNSEGPKDGSHNTGATKMRERGQNHSRRGGGGGNFYGRQSGSVRVDAAGYD